MIKVNGFEIQREYFPDNTLRLLNFDENVINWPMNQEIDITWLYEGEYEIFHESFVGEFAGELPDNLAEVIRRNEQGVLERLLYAFCGKIGVRVEVPHAGHEHIAGLVIVRGVVLIGALAPSGEVSPVSLVKSHLHVVQEVCRAGAGAAGQARFHGHGIAFSADRGGIEHPAQRSGTLSHCVG